MIEGAISPHISVEVQIEEVDGGYQAVVSNLYDMQIRYGALTKQMAIRGARELIGQYIGLDWKDVRVEVVR